MTDQNKPILHPGEARSAPYPVSRLAPAFDTGELAAEIAKAEAMLSARTGAKLRVIADQIRLLQQEARRILSEAQDEQSLNRAECGFKRIPGKTYHLYRRANGKTFFSMLSPEDWGGNIPQEFIGSYRLELDYSWTPAERASQVDDTGEMVSQLLRIGGLTGEGSG